MVRSDSWKKRPVVLKYWEYKNKLVSSGAKINPNNHLKVTFYMPMSKSWSKKKKALHDGTPHQNKPDIDNLLKAFMDSLLDEDQAVWSVTATKLWAEKGSIEYDDSEK